MIDLQDKGDLRALGDIVRDLRDHSAGADFMLVGAAARDLWLQHHHGIEPRRKTTDVDFAFAVSDWPAYIALTKRLIDTGGFKPDDRTQHRLRNRIGTVVDHAFRVAGLERLHDVAPELFDLDNFDPELAGAWSIGFQARTVIDRHSQRAQAIVTRASMIVARETDPNGSLGLIGEVEARDPERARRKLGAFGNGLTGVRAL